MARLLDHACIVGTASPYFDGKRRYVSTGALDCDRIDEEQVEIVDYHTKPSRANLVAECGDILFAKMQYTQKTILLDETTSKNIYSTGFCALRAKNTLIPRCLFYIISSEQFLRQKNKNCSGATQKAITNEGLARVSVSIPNKRVQAQLVKILDRISDLIFCRKQQISKLDELVKSQFIEMFGDMLINSMGWPEATLASLADIVSGITKGRKTKEENLFEVPYMAVSNVKDGYIDWTTVKTIMATEQEISQYRLLPDDVLMTEGGDPDKVGRGAIIRKPLESCIHQNHIFRVRLNKGMVIPTFFAEYLQHQKSKRYFLSCAKQTTGIASINMRQLNALPVLLPPVELQEQFGFFVEQTDKSKLEIQKSLDELEILKKALMQKYFG